MRSIVMWWRKVTRHGEQRTSSRTISCDKWNNSATTMNASPTHMLSYLSLDGVASHRYLCSSASIQSRFVFTLDLRCFLHCSFIPHFINKGIDDALRKCAAFVNKKLCRTSIYLRPWIYLLLWTSLPFLVFIVSGIDIHLITPITCVCCIFYTCVGGIKAGGKKLYLYPMRLFQQKADFVIKRTVLEKLH